ncbi:MAG: flippase-like domain-containing protein [Deltaproteobacteria bacterium]|nr:flippase-like domain-containing protein [Deltaproteobacteria bacterium]
MDIKKYIYLILKISVSAMLIMFLVRKADANSVMAVLYSMNLMIFAFSIILYALIQVISAYRWSLFLPKAGIDMPFQKLVSLYYIGMFFNIFLPTAIGGDVVKTYYLYKISGRGGNSLASVFLDRFTGFFALVIIASVSLIFGYSYVKDTYAPVFIITLAIVFFLSCLVLWNKNIHNIALAITSKIRLFAINEKIESIYRAVMVYKDEPLILLRAITISFIIQMIGIAISFLISKGIGMSVSLGYFYLFVPIAVTISMLPISVSGLGLREGAFVYLFTKVGATDAQALSVSLAVFLIMVLLGLGGGIEYIRHGSVKDTVK